MNVKNILILTQIKGIGPVFFKKNRDKLMNNEDVISFIANINPEAMSSISLYEKIAEDIINKCNIFDIKIISFLSKDYPPYLLEINDPPPILYMKGNLSLIQNAIAIIGTRNSTPLGNSIAERLGLYFSQHFAICNGLVEGIDEHSIYSNGKILKNVVGVISGGLDYNTTCSKKHAKIIDDVLAAGGLIISEFPPQQLEDRYSGSKASRIQAGLSKGLILVQSKIDGGSKYTLSTFAKLNRTVGVIHYPMSEEYNTEVFSANRLIVNENIIGILKIIELKTSKKILLQSIITIQDKNDYEIFKDKILKPNQNNISLF